MNRKQLTINTQFFQDNLEGIPDAYLLTGPTVQSPNSVPQSQIIQDYRRQSVQIIERVITNKFVQNIIQSWEKLKTNYYSSYEEEIKYYENNRSRYINNKINNSVRYQYGSTKNNKLKNGQIQYNRAKIMQQIVQKLKRAKNRVHIRQNITYNQPIQKIINIQPVNIVKEEPKQFINQQIIRNNQWEQHLRYQISDLNSQIKNMKIQMENTQLKLKRKQQQELYMKQKQLKRNESEQLIANAFLQQNKAIIKMQEKQRQLLQKRIQSMQNSFNIISKQIQTQQNKTKQKHESTSTLTIGQTQNSLLKELINQTKLIKGAINQLQLRQESNSNSIPAKYQSLYNSSYNKVNRHEPYALYQDNITKRQVEQKTLYKNNVRQDISNNQIYFSKKPYQPQVNSFNYSKVTNLPIITQSPYQLANNNNLGINRQKIININYKTNSQINSRYTPQQLVQSHIETIPNQKIIINPPPNRFQTYGYNRVTVNNLSEQSSCSQDYCCF